MVIAAGGDWPNATLPRRAAVQLAVATLPPKPYCSQAMFDPSFRTVAVLLKSCDSRADDESSAITVSTPRGLSPLTSFQA